MTVPEARAAAVVQQNKMRSVLGQIEERLRYAGSVQETWELESARRHVLGLLGLVDDALHYAPYVIREEP